jgi:hypothetical protein
MIPRPNLDHEGHSGDECGKSGGQPRAPARRSRAVHSDDADCGDEIARLGYEAIAGQDTRAASEALRLFISDIIACSIPGTRFVPDAP